MDTRWISGDGNGAGKLYLILDVVFRVHKHAGHIPIEIQILCSGVAVPANWNALYGRTMINISVLECYEWSNMTLHVPDRALISLHAWHQEGSNHPASPALDTLDCAFPAYLGRIRSNGKRSFTKKACVSRKCSQCGCSPHRLNQYGDKEAW